MKRYFVALWTKNSRSMYATTNSLRVAKWIANLRVWKIAKVSDTHEHECVYYIKREL